MIKCSSNISLLYTYHTIMSVVEMHELCLHVTTAFYSVLFIIKIAMYSLLLLLSMLVHICYARLDLCYLSFANVHITNKII